MASINDIKSLINKRGGLARPNRFMVDFSYLINLNIAPLDNLKDLNLLVDSISIPGRSINTFDYSIWNHPIKVPGGYDEDDIEIVFNVTRDYVSKVIMDSWFAKVINQWTYMVNYDSQYKSDLIIKQLDENDKVIFSAKLINAYPISVKGIFLDNNADSSVSRFSSTIAFDRFVSDNSDITTGRPIREFIEM